MGPIYLDNAASTPILRDVWEAMRPWAERAGNPASSHAFGRAARQALDRARQTIAQCLDADADEVVFTSGATEANNLAVFGLAGDFPGIVIHSAIEHPCVAQPIAKLLERGLVGFSLPVEPSGVVGIPTESWPGDVRLATLMLVNHETGAIQPVGELGSRLPAKTPFHCDAAAAVGKMPVSFRELGVSTMTLSGHKFHGPQGVGALLVRRGVRLRPMTLGGHQQAGKRPGTEAVALAVGLAAALERATSRLDENLIHVRHVRTAFRAELDAARPVVLNSSDAGIPHILNVSFPGLRGDALLMALDLSGVACSTGSACSSGSLLPSPVLRAMGTANEALVSAMRFSFSPATSVDEAIEAARRIVRCVNRLRQHLPADRSTGDEAFS